LLAEGEAMKPMHAIRIGILAVAICGASPALAGISTVPGTRDIIPIRKQLVYDESDPSGEVVVVSQRRTYKMEKLLNEQRSIPRWPFQIPLLPTMLSFLR
jgi:hypothetical protein